MESKEIRERFLKFFEKRGHAVIPSASLVPENDPSVLFTTAGMQPLIPYLLGERHPAGDKLVNVQKCVRTGDLEDIGDNRHFSFFEMMGNWSLGSYFKKEAISWSHEFLTSKEEGLGLDPSRLYVTIFEGDENAPFDAESKETWMALGMPERRIYPLDADNNWWSPGNNGPCGPDTEMFYDLTEQGLGDLSKEEFLAAVKREDVVEIWNDVFMEFQKKDGKVFGKLAQQNVDTGAGLERISAVMQGKKTGYDTDIFAEIFATIHAQAQSENAAAERIVADHVRASVFMIADGVVPSNTDRGYVLRRLLRRAVRYADILGMKPGSLSAVAQSVIEKYEDVYPNVSTNAGKIKKEINDEETRFRDTLENGLRVLNKEMRAQIIKPGGKYEPQDLSLVDGFPGFTPHHINGEWLFDFYQKFGFPFELLIEELQKGSPGRQARDFFPGDIEKLKKEFDNAFKKHQELSRQGAEQKFKGGLLDHSPQSVKYHTATHLLHQALRQVLGTHVFQKGSNITPERLRFDFSFERKMTDEEKQEVEAIVNAKIQESLPVSYEDLSLEEAEKRGALGLFEEKYGDKVRVYKVGDFSLEFCGGPHVSNTKELGRFKIQKEEASSAGIRRIKAVLE